MNKTKLDYTNVKIETGLPIPSMRHKRRVQYRPIKQNSLVGVLQSLKVGQSAFIPIARRQIKSLSVCVTQAKKRLPGYDFTVRNYFTVADTYKGVRVWRTL